MNCLVYYREMTLTYGLWDQVRVDHGKEFHLMLYVQEIWHTSGLTLTGLHIYNQHHDR